MTKKELIEGGWVDKYILGLTSEAENHEVERLANLYPEVQEELNQARSRLCGKFNRSLTQPALRSSFLTKRRVMYTSAIALFILLGGFLFLWREHFSLKKVYTSQCEKLAAEEARVRSFTSLTKLESEQSDFIHSKQTKKIKLKGCDESPEAEVVIFQCKLSGKMMLRVIDLPEIAANEHYEVWSQESDATSRLIGKMENPIRMDTLYILEPSLQSVALQINRVNTTTLEEMPVCLASIDR